MHSSVNHFVYFSLLLLSFNLQNMRPLMLSSSSQTTLFEFPSVSHNHFTFLGDSHLQDRVIALTKEGMLTNAPKSAGVVLYNRPILFLDRQSKRVPSFYTKFSFSIENIYHDREAFGDGLTFLISPDGDLLGSPRFLGLVDSTDLTKNKFIAVEFDTKCDSMFLDPDDNHVGLDINNLFSVKLATASSVGVNLKSGNLINTWIDYKSDDKRLEVFLSNLHLKPKKPILRVDIDLYPYVKENMFIGFSAATEGTVQLTHIERWEFTIVEFSPPPPPSPPEPIGTFPNHYESEQKHGHLSRFAIGITVGLCSVVIVFGWFCWKKLMAIFRKSEGSNNIETQTIRSSGGLSCHEIQLSILGLDSVRALGKAAEFIRVKTVKSSVPLYNNLPVTKPRIVPLGNGLPPKTKETRQMAPLESDDGERRADSIVC